MKRLLLCSCSLVLLLATSAWCAPLDSWHWRSPLPAGNDLTGVAYGSGRFVAVGNYREILTSTDGLSWTDRSLPFDDPNALPSAGFTAVEYLNGIFIALTGDGRIFASPDGISWEKKTVPAIAGLTLGAVTWGEGKYVVTGGVWQPSRAGRILVSDDAETWTALPYEPAGAHLGSIVYGNGVFVAAEIFGGKLHVSEDGTSWAEGATLTADATMPRPVFFLGGLFLTSTYSYVPGRDPVTRYDYYQSADGRNWTSEYYTTHALLAASHGEGKTVAMDSEGNVHVLPDGGSWSDVGNCRVNEINLFSGMAHGGGRFVATGHMGTIYVSDDGISWSCVTKYRPLVSWESVTFCGGRFIASGFKMVDHRLRQVLASSPDGDRWTQRLTPGHWGKSAAFGNGVYVSVGLNGSIRTSPDALTWTARESNTQAHLYGVAFARGRFVAVGGRTGQSNSGVIITSPDGIRWSAVRTGMGRQLTDIVYGNNRFVAVGVSDGGKGTAFRSWDGVTWLHTDIEDTPPYRVGTIRAVAFGNGIFTAINSWAVSLTSVDGRTWRARVLYPTAAFADIAFGGGRFVIAGGYVGGVTSSVYSAADGASWRKRWNCQGGLKAAAYGTRRFLLMGDHLSAQSDPL